MVEFYALTFPCFSLRKNTNPTLVKIELATCALACAGYLLDHSGDEGVKREKEKRKVRGMDFKQRTNCLSAKVSERALVAWKSMPLEIYFSLTSLQTP